MTVSGWLSRLRVPLGWALGLAAMYLSRPTPALLLVGMAAAAAGEALRLWASGHLEKNRRLTKSGPYAWTRNPLYLGSFFVGLGFCIASGRPLLLALLAVLFVAVYVPVMKREAVRLQAAYPAAYPPYASSVPLFVPRPPAVELAELEDDSRFSWKRVVANREHVTVCGLLLVVSVLWGKWLFGR